MKLTPKMLSKIEQSLWTSLTREQRAIMLCWFGSEGRCPWEYQDFLIGFKNVRYFYPDHRPKDVTLPSFIVKTPDGDQSLQQLTFDDVMSGSDGIPF